ncbi:hypothetical protein Tco_1075440 [Tanacetum coccineum]
MVRDCQHGNYKAGGDSGGGGNVLSRVLKGCRVKEGEGNPGLAELAPKVILHPAIIGDGTATISLTCFSDQANSLTRDCNELIAELPDKDLYHLPSTLKELKAPPVQNTLPTPTLAEQQEYMPPPKTHSPDVFRIHLPSSLATLVVVKEEINKRCKLNPAPCKLKYLDENEE